MFVIAYVDIVNNYIQADPKPETKEQPQELEKPIMETVEKPQPPVMEQVISKKETAPVVVAQADPKPVDNSKMIIKKEWSVDDERQDFINYAYQKG